MNKMDYFPVQCAECGAALMRRTWNPTKKRPVLFSFCDNKCKAAYQRRQKPVDKEWLVQKYLVEKLDCAEIGRLIGRDTKGVWNWLKGYGIETRPRGSEVSKQWERGLRTPRPGTPHTEASKEKIRQARLRDGRVPYLTKDGEHYMRGRRGPAHHGWKGGLTPEREALAASDEWKDAIKIVWARSDAKCERCGKDHRTIKDRKKEAFDIHHIVSFQYRPMRTVVSNLVLLCEPCHYWVHSRRNTKRDFLRDIPNEAP